MGTQLPTPIRRLILNCKSTRSQAVRPAASRSDNVAVLAAVAALAPIPVVALLAMAVLPMNVKDGNGYPKNPDHSLMFLRFVARRYLVFGLTGFLAFTLLFRMLYFPPEVILESPAAGQERSSSRWPGARLPPLYSQYHEYDLRLPQHHWHASSHEAEPKFFFVPGHSRGMIYIQFHAQENRCSTGLTDRFRMG